MIVLDTNALIWWINDTQKLSKKARKIIQEAEEKRTIYISSISVLEIYLLIKKGRLGLYRMSGDWLQKVEDLSYVHFIPIDNKIAVQSIELPDFSHQDPADRIIIATALNLGAKLITSDKRILNYPAVQSVW